MTKLIKHSLNPSTFYSALSMLWGFFTAAVITSELGLEEFGIYNLIISITSILLSISCFRSGEILVRFHHDLINYDFKLISILFLLDFIPFTLIFSLLYVFTNWFSQDYIRFLYVILVYSILEILKYIVIGVFQVSGRMSVFYTFSCFGLVISMLILVWIISFGELRKIENIFIYLFAGSGSSMVCCTYYLYMYGLNPNRDATRRYNDIKEILTKRYMLNSWLSSLIKAGHNRAESPIVAALISVDALGLFSLLKQFLAPSNIFTSQLSNNNSALVTNMAVSNKSTDLQCKINEINKNTSFIVAAVGVLGVACSQAYLVFVVEGQDFEVRNLILSVLLFVTMLVSYGQWWTRPVSLSIDSRISVVGNIISSLFIIFVLPIFIIIFGLIGAPVVQILRHLSVKWFFWKKCFG